MAQLQKMLEKSQAYDNIIASLDEYKIHTKGFMFDSLVYRFKDYQARAFQTEVIDYKFKHNCSKTEARNVIRNNHNRDLMRFIQILDEAIGEHD